MESRIKQLRENRGLIQEILASELGITQQMLSKYERDVLCIKVDVLKRIAEYFNDNGLFTGSFRSEERFARTDESEQDIRHLL